MRNENHKSGPNTRQCAAMAAVAASPALLGKRRKEPLSLPLSYNSDSATALSFRDAPFTQNSIKLLYYVRLA